MLVQGVEHPVEIVNACGTFQRCGEVYCGECFETPQELIIHWVKQHYIGGKVSRCRWEGCKLFGKEFREGRDDPKVLGMYAKHQFTHLTAATTTTTPAPDQQHSSASHDHTTDKHNPHQCL